MSREWSYAWSALTTADTQQWSELMNALAKVDGTEEFYSPEDLAEELAYPDVDTASDTWAVHDEGGTLVGYGQVSFRGALIDGAAATSISAGVHPDHRGRGIGTELCRLIEQRSRRANAHVHPGKPVVLRADTGVQVSDARQLLSEHGFVESRYFHELEHDLSELAPAAEPTGVRAYEGGRDDAAVLDVHTRAFAEHWRSAPLTSPEWASHIVEARSFRPALSFVHLDGPSGAVDGYVLCHEYVDNEVWVSLLGVLESARGRGIGTSLLSAVLAAARAGGYRKVGLDVDSENNTGAGRLYEHLGFRRARATVACLKTLEPLPPPAGSTGHVG